MVRKSLQRNKIDNSTSRHIAYSRRKDGLVKMVNEISVLGDSEAGLVMFSPSGKLTCASGNNGRIEDIFLRYINEPDEVHGTIENEEQLYLKLKQSKCEGEMLELIEKKENLEKKLLLLKRRHLLQEHKLRFYQPDMDRITSVHEAIDHEHYLNNALERIGKMKEKLLGRENVFKVPNSVELQSVRILNRNPTFEESVISERIMRNPSMDANHQVAIGLPTTGSSINGNLLTHWSTAPSMATPTCIPTGPPQPGIDHHLNNNNQRLWNNFPSVPSVGSSSSSAANQMENFNVDQGGAFQGFDHQQGFPNIS